MSVNKVILLGNIGKDPEEYRTEDVYVVKFSIATSDKWTNKAGELQEKTEWHNCVAFAKTGEAIMKHVQKGDMLFIEGSNQTRKYEKDGVDHYMTEIKVKTFNFCGGKKEKSEPDPMGF